MNEYDIILHGLRDRDEVARTALKRLVERAENAEAELSHSILDATAVLVQGKADALARAETAEDNITRMGVRVRELETALKVALNFIDGLGYPSRTTRDLHAVLAGGKDAAIAEERAKPEPKDVCLFYDIDGAVGVGFLRRPSAIGGYETTTGTLYDRAIVLMRAADVRRKIEEASRVEAVFDPAVAAMIDAAVKDGQK